RRRRVDAAEAGEDDRPVVIVELAGEEERAGEAVVLGAVVAVVLVSRDGVDPEAAVLAVERQVVVLAEEDRLAVTADDELWWDRPVEGPHLQRVLGGQARVESRGKGDGRIDSRVELRRDAGIVGDVGLGP